MPGPNKRIASRATETVRSDDVEQKEKGHEGPNKRIASRATETGSPAEPTRHRDHSSPNKRIASRATETLPAGVEVEGPLGPLVQIKESPQGRLKHNPIVKNRLMMKDTRECMQTSSTMLD